MRTFLRGVLMRLSSSLPRHVRSVSWLALTMAVLGHMGPTWLVLSATGEAADALADYLSSERADQGQVWAQQAVTA